MKKTLLFLTTLLTINIVVSQNVNRYGTEYPNATEETDFSTYSRVPLMNENGLLNAFIHSDNIALKSQLSKASNGLTKTNDTIKLGGLITKDTEIISKRDSYFYIANQDEYGRDLNWLYQDYNSINLVNVVKNELDTSDEDDLLYSRIGVSKAGIILKAEQDYNGIDKYSSITVGFDTTIIKSVNEVTSDESQFLVHDSDISLLTDTFKTPLQTPPTSLTDFGTEGDWKITADGIYICTSQDNWILLSEKNNQISFYNDNTGIGFTDFETNDTGEKLQVNGLIRSNATVAELEIADEQVNITKAYLESILNPTPIKVGATGAAQFENGWSNYGSLYGDLHYYKIGNRVYLRGFINGGVGGVFTLPIGYRPSSRTVISTIDDSGIARIDVNTSGLVESHTSNSNFWLSLNNISFIVE